MCDPHSRAQCLILSQLCGMSCHGERSLTLEGLRGLPYSQHQSFPGRKGFAAQLPVDSGSAHSSDRHRLPPRDLIVLTRGTWSWGLRT